MSERPISETQELRGRRRGARSAGGVQEGSGDRAATNVIDTSDSIWDPEIRNSTDQNPKPATALAQRRRKSKFDNPADPEDDQRELPKLLPLPTATGPTLVPAFPQAAGEQTGSGLFWFVMCVLLPTVVAGYYYYRVASNQYSAEFRFSVRDATTQASTAGASGLLAILGTTSTASSNNYLVVDYLKSRPAVDALQKRIDIVHLYSKPEIDWWSRFNASKPIESFVRYWGSTVIANYDQVTGIATAKVRAFSANDALLVANSLVSLSEELVNDIANRSYNDAVRFAQSEVEKAETRLKNVRERLTEYRNRVGVIDPNTSVVASAANLVQSLRATLAQQEAQLATMLRQQLLPTAPPVVTVKNQIQSTKEQLERITRDVGKNPDGSPLSMVMGEYEKLDLERQFAQTMLTGSMQALDQARANAAAQHLYITPYVRPTLPTTPTYPDQAWSTLEAGGLAFIVWLILLLITRAMRERFA